MTRLADFDFTDEEYPSNMPDAPAIYTHATPKKLVAPVNPVDPSMLGYPPALLVELALRSNPLNEILESHSIDEVEWERIRQDPTFITDLARVVESIKDDGAFKMKAKLQAEALLQTTWSMIHDIATPPAVRADLIKSTVKWSGLEPASGDGGVGGGGAGFSININFNGAKPEPRLVGDS